MKHLPTHWSEKYFDLLHCHSGIQTGCYELQESLLLFILQSDSLRTTEDLTSWHNLYQRSAWEWENRSKNAEECRVEENKGGSRSSPQIPIKFYPKDQKDLVIRRWERPKDAASTLASTQIIPSVTISTTTGPCKRSEQEAPSHVKIQKKKYPSSTREAAWAATQMSHCQRSLQVIFLLFVGWKHLLPLSCAPQVLKG